MEPEIRFCTTSDSVRIAYATAGEGPPLIYVPGWVSHLKMAWEHPDARRHYERLAEHFLLVMYDKRGSGLSDRNVAHFSLDSWLLDLEAVAANVKTRRVALFGTSEGGPLSIAYAARHPRRVSRLALYGTYASPTRVGREAAVDALEALVRAEWGLGSRTLSDVFMPGASPEEKRWFVKWQQVAATGDNAAAMMHVDSEMDVLHLLPQVKCPALVVHATGDLVVPFEFGREIAGGIASARLVPVESDRHILVAEQWRSVEDTMIDFLLEGTTKPETVAPAPPELGPLTVLFTDVEASTSLTDRLGDAKARDILRTHERIVRDALRSHGGSEVKTMGDGFMASFSSATKALECAIAVQRSFEEHNETAEEPIKVRVGLNAGEPIAEEEDLFGTAVIVAARIAGKAEGGEIIASDVVRQLVAGKGFLFADRGDTALRGFEDPVRLFEVRWREEG